MVLPEASVAIQFTIVTPFGKVEPDGGIHITVTPGQLSFTVTTKVTFDALHWPGSVESTMFVGQTKEGGSVSSTVIVKLQLTILLLASVTTNVLVVIPFGNVEPLGSPAVCVSTAPGQLVLKVTTYVILVRAHKPGLVARTMLVGQVIVRTQPADVTPMKLVFVIVFVPTAPVAVRLTV